MLYRSGFTASFLIVSSMFIAPYAVATIQAKQPPAVGGGVMSADAPQPPDFELPAEIGGDPGTFIPVRPKTKGKWIVYVPMTEGLQVFPSDMLANKTQTVVIASKPGRYKMLAYSAVNNVPTLPAYTTIVVGGVVPTPPTPPPVDPPTPPPVDPKTDPLWSAVSTGYLSDTPVDPQARKLAANRWANYYRAAATTIERHTSGNLDMLWKDVSATLAAQTPPLDFTQLAKSRAPLKDEIGKIVTTTNAPGQDQTLTPETQKQLTALFRRFGMLIDAAAMQ